MIEIKYSYNNSKRGKTRVTHNYSSLNFIKMYSNLRPSDPFKSMNKDHVITITEVKFWN